MIISSYNNKHEDAKDEKLLNDHIRNEYFRLVMMDPLMQRSIIVEENKKVGLLLFSDWNHSITLFASSTSMRLFE